MECWRNVCCQLPVPQASRPDIDQAGAATRSPGDPLFDTSTSQGRLLVTMLAAIAEFERELIRERTEALLRAYNISQEAV